MTLRLGKCLTIGAFAGLIVLEGCTAGSGLATTGKNLQGDNAALPNPSTRKCLTIGAFAGLIVLEGCTTGSGVATTGKNMQGDNAALPNPSTRKCLDDGYEVETVEVHGVPSVQYCVDRKTGLKCEAWAYFRGECRFELLKPE